MISYLKIEIFAYNIFNTVWYKGGLISHKHDAYEIYKDECLVESDFEEVCDKLFYDAVLCRRILFQNIYMEEIVKEKDRHWNSLSDFFSYIHVTCKRNDWFGCLSVFERVFATCAFVINLCFYNRENENVDIIKFGYIFWAMYFDEFTEEFYKQGGWNELKRSSNFYTFPLLFLQTCLQESENILLEVTAAIQNYNMLKETSTIEECETVSKLWVKSRIKNLCISSDIPVEFVCDKKCLHVEYILNELKRLCNPCASEVLQYDEECSERTVFDSDSFYIPLTPTGSQKSTPIKNSFSVSFNEIDNLRDRFGEDVLIFSSLDCRENLSQIDNNDFVNQSFLNELRNSSSSNFSDDVSCDCLQILGHPIEFESICLISDCEPDQYLSRRMNNMQLNHETLELEESNISEDLCGNKNDSYSLGDFDLNTKDLIYVPQKETNEESQNPEDLNFANLSDNGSKSCPNKLFNEFQFVRGTMFFNTALSNDNTISISEWDENDLAKNISTPIKEKKSRINIKKV